ncbi:transcriptional regulator with XRE-family HTH domain [Thermocatellispora tengchongensis]|uniref:Transcriptional regulator with XRE-family HTH domain n=1 Tax=Thermocatellispora tengchongensis TaxID=1073253 RepID=A0A840P551_9ACTN|nr:helix-turn-helix transcriptional regulator [Thermocatellispora tengchongensis]MBB5132610.1 transcriptional regulator with XRE-family HTH domain [Thermocatellispora tengchongensis]
MGDVSTIGAHLKAIRNERGLSQEALAERAGLSKDLISKLEQGRRHSCRITSLMKLANALDVELTALTGKRERLGSDRDGGSVLAIRDAILSPSLLPGMHGMDHDDEGEPTPQPRLAAALASCWNQYWDGDFGALTAATPGLIAEARLAHRALGPEAVGALAQSYQLAANLMVHLGKTDLAAVAAERAITTAVQGDDEWQWASAHATYAWVLEHQARLDEAEALAVRVAQRIEPSFSAPAPHVAVWGNMLITAIGAAALQGEAVTDRVMEYVSLAAAGAERLGRTIAAYQTTFGPSKVAVNETRAWALLGEPKRALTAAQKVRAADLRPIAYGHYLLDVAQASMDARQYAAVERRLSEAERISPVWFRHQGAARALVREIREVVTRPSPTVRHLVKAVGLD